MKQTDYGKKNQVFFLLRKSEDFVFGQDICFVLFFSSLVDRHSNWGFPQTRK